MVCAQMRPRDPFFCPPEFHQSTSQILIGYSARTPLTKQTACCEPENRIFGVFFVWTASFKVPSLQAPKVEVEKPISSEAEAEAGMATCPCDRWT